MTKIVNLLLVTTIYSFTQTLSVNVSLSPHTDSSYGTWELKYINAKHIDEQFREKIIRNKNSRTSYFIPQTDIEIFQKALYQRNFLKQGYYRLDWIASKNTIGNEIGKISSKTKQFLKESEFFKNYHEQDGWEELDWSTLLADYINNSISTIPSYEFQIKNNSKKNIEIKEFYAKTIFTTGGEASSGGAYFPPQSRENYFPLHWNHKKILKLDYSIIVDSKQSVTIPINIIVKKGALGRGPGRLTVAIFVKYLEGKKKKTELLTILSQSEDYGYQTEW